MKSKTVDYRTVRHHDMENFELESQKLLKDGWESVGGATYYCGYFLQAFVKKEYFHTEKLYETISFSDIVDFKKCCKRMLDLGWEPLSGVSIAITPDNYAIIYAQSFTKEKVIKDDKK